MLGVLKRKAIVRVTVFALLLTMVAWVVPVREVNAVAEPADAVSDLNLNLDIGDDIAIPEVNLEYFNEESVDIVSDLDIGKSSEDGTKKAQNITTLSKESTETITFKEDNITYKIVSDGCVEIIKYEKEIPGKLEFDSMVTYEGKVYSIARIADELFRGNKEITSVFFPDTIEYIGWNAFNACDSIYQIQLPNNENLIIENSAFAGCRGLLELEIPEHLKHIQHYAFSGCTNLATVHLNTINCERMVDRQGLDEGIFKNCPKLKTVYIGENVKTIPGVTFQDCIGLENVYYKGNQVTKIGASAFSNCRNLTTFDFSEPLEYIGEYAFSGCRSLKDINFPKSLKEIASDSFMACTSLKEITIPENVKKMGWGIFGSCNNIEKINFNATNCNSMGGSGWQSYLWAFGKVDGLSDDLTGVTELVIGENVETIPQYAFGGCPNLKTIKIPASVTTMHVNSFERLPSLASIEVDEGNKNYQSKDGIVYTKDGTTIFRCPEGKAILKENCFENITKIGDNAFNSCRLIKTVKMTDRVEIIGSYAFVNCSALSELELSNNKNLVINNYAFQSCNSLEKISIPENVKKLNTGVFYRCTKLKEVYYYAKECTAAKPFDGCSNLECAYIVGDVKKLPPTIFYNSGIKEILFSGKLTTIGENAFANCSRLEAIVLPKTIEKIEQYAFNGCQSLKYIYIYNDSCVLYNSGSTIHSGTIIFGYADSSAESYAAKYGREFRYIDSEYTGSGIEIIDRVSEYTSDELFAQFADIVEKEASYETKSQMYLNLFTKYGFTNVQEGVQYISKSQDKRFAYLTLTTDEIYCANNFKYKVEHSPAMQVVLLADNLIFGGEINDWLDFTTYMEADYPGVSKYKTMLYEFMDATSESIEVQSKIKLVTDLSKNVTGVAKQKADNLVEKLNACKSIKDQKELLESSEASKVWVELSEKRDENGNVTLSYKLDESSGFGQFSKAMGIATKAISITDMAVTDVLDLLTFDSKLAIYAQYKDFLEDVKSNTKDLPFELRWAASQILEELDTGYLAKIKAIAFDILKQTDINKEIKNAALQKIGATNFASWLTTINLEAYFINKVADIGAMVKKEAYVEGYAYLASAFRKQLEKSKQTFLQNETEENAWNFYYNYNILYKLRHKGEEAYLAMSKVEGIVAILSDFGYSIKEEHVKETLDMLEQKCQFNLDEAKAIPESCQFATKAAISCPVDIDVYTPDGTLVATLKDGKESDMTNQYGRFAVVYDAYSSNYVKVICLNTNENFRFRLTGTDDGLVSLKLAQKGEPATYSFDNVSITVGATIEADIKQVIQQNTYDVDDNGDGTIDATGVVSVKKEDYTPVKSLSLKKKEIQLKEGESAVMQVAISPSDASIQTLLWLTADPSIAKVFDGKVIAVSEGMTTVYCTSQDNPEIVIPCAITVVSGKTGPTGPSTDPTEPSTDSTKPTEKPDIPSNNPTKPEDSATNPTTPIGSVAPTVRPTTPTTPTEPTIPGEDPTEPSIEPTEPTENITPTSPEQLPAKAETVADKNSKAIYGIIKTGKKAGTATYRKPTKKTVTSVAVPSTITVKGVPYKVTAIAPNAFKDCKKLKKVTIGDNILTIGTSAFSGCSKLKQLRFGKNVTIIGNKAFYKCTALTKIIIPAKVIKIGKKAFYGCKKLSSITIKTTKLTKKRVGASAFKGTAAKAKVKTPKGKTKAYKKLLQSKGLSKKATVK